QRRQAALAQDAAHLALGVAVDHAAHHASLRIQRLILESSHKQQNLQPPPRTDRRAVASVPGSIRVRTRASTVPSRRYSRETRSTSSRLVSPASTQRSPSSRIERMPWARACSRSRSSEAPSWISERSGSSNVSSSNTPEIGRAHV